MAKNKRIGCLWQFITVLKLIHNILAAIKDFTPWPKGPVGRMVISALAIGLMVVCKQINPETVVGPLQKLGELIRNVGDATARSDKAATIAPPTPAVPKDGGTAAAEVKLAAPEPAPATIPRPFVKAGKTRTDVRSVKRSTPKCARHRPAEVYVRCGKGRVRIGEVCCWSG